LGFWGIASRFESVSYCFEAASFGLKRLNTARASMITEEENPSKRNIQQLPVQKQMIESHATRNNATSWCSELLCLEAPRPEECRRMMVVAAPATAGCSYCEKCGEILDPTGVDSVDVCS